jgi:hypothetical protein
MTYYEFIKHYKPDANDEECEFILWGMTAYPATYDTRILSKQIRSAIRRIKNKRYCCDYCGLPRSLGHKRNCVLCSKEKVG